MTRRSNLSPVPDSPRSGVDLAELRESVGLPPPATPRAVEPSAAVPTDSPARQRLQRAQSALQRKLDAAEQRERQLAPLRQQLDDVRADRTRLERSLAEAREPLTRWQADPTSGPCPSLSPEARERIRVGREQLEALADQENAINAAVGRLQAEQQQAQQRIGPAQREIQAAVAAVLLEADDACQVRVRETFAAFQRARAERLAIRSGLHGSDDPLANWRAEQIRRELDVELRDPTEETVREQIRRYSAWERALESNAAAVLE